jgi:L-rhamnose mutarotase
MQRHAFKMFLNPGAAEEYRRRRDAIWLVGKALLREKGVRNSNSSIYRNAETSVLIGYLERSGDHAHKKPIMAANPDGSPVTAPVVKVFHLE